MPPFPIPRVPWQTTGNHWLSLPCIHPVTGAVHAVGVLHRGARSAIEFAGAPEFADGGGAPLFGPVFRVNGERRDLAGEGIAWERAVGWLPTFTCTVGTLVVRGTIFAPCGRDADMSGAVYALTVENRGGQRQRVEVALEGTLGHRQQRIRSARAFDDQHCVALGDDDTIILEGAAIPGVASLAVGADGPVERRIAPVERGAALGPVPFSMARSLEVEPGDAMSCAFYIAVAPERDGACATISVLRRRGWRALLSATREALQQLEQSTGSEPLDRLLNRNLLFAYFYGVGRALDDTQFYLVRTRAPWHSVGVTVRDWEALMWTVSAVLLADAPLARELIVRACELHGYAPGQGVHYLDGTLFEPGFSIEGPAAFPIAIDRYIRASEDDQIVEEPVVADTLYVSYDDMVARRDERLPLYATEVGPSGDAVRYPFTLHGNAAVAAAFDVLRRTLDEEAAAEVEDPSAVRSAMRRHFSRDRGGNEHLAACTDLVGGLDQTDHPASSVLWLPLFDAMDRDEPLFVRTVRALVTDRDERLLRHVGRLLGPDGAAVMQWLRRAPLDQGVAATVVDEQGRAIADGGDAALAGLLAASVWYAVHGLGITES